LSRCRQTLEQIQPGCTQPRTRKRQNQLSIYFLDTTLVAGKRRLKSLELVPFNDGRFEVFKNDLKVHSKLETHSFPDEDSLIRQIF
ncbi:MAG: hypothetical protein FJW26_10420, partial [Acidimicrobiia bacterium]|nr:hypothetical protein [Acidimicrobiia bacterium]